METKINNGNYFSGEMMNAFWSVSQYKAFEKCEAAAVAELNGTWTPDPTTALLIGSYVDAYFSNELPDFIDRNPQIFNSRSGALKAEYKKADEIIKRIQRDDYFMDHLNGVKQKIFTGELFGVPWKIKTDVWRDDRIVDLKVVKDMGDIYDPGRGPVSFIEFWGYDLQAAIYTRIEQIANNRPEPLPFFLAVATKEKETAIEVIKIPEFEQEAALKHHGVERNIRRFNLVKTGQVPPIRCENCDYCKRTRKLTKYKTFTIEGGIE